MTKKWNMIQSETRKDVEPLFTNQLLMVEHSTK